MAAQLPNAAQHAVVQALLVQASWRPKIARTIAAQQEATAAQRRAVDATERALSVLTSPPRLAGWQFTQSGAEEIGRPAVRGPLGWSPKSTCHALPVHSTAPTRPSR